MKKNKRIEFNEFVKDYIFLLAIVNSPEPKEIRYTERFVPQFKAKLYYMDSVMFE